MQAEDPYKEQRIVLGGLAGHLDDIRHGRRMVLVACGTSYLACLAARKTMEVRTAPLLLACNFAL